MRPLGLVGGLLAASLALLRLWDWLQRREQVSEVEPVRRLWWRRLFAITEPDAYKQERAQRPK